MSERNFFEEIARVAYELWERDGCIHGRDIEHWCEAEHSVISHIQPNEEEKPKKARPQGKTTTKTTTKSTRTAAKARKPSGSSKKG